MTTSLASRLRGARHAVVLTGAGVSTASGIPDFRGDHGLWSRADAARVASIDGFRADPHGFYAFWKEKLALIGDARPNLAHVVIARLEARSLVHTVVTQNVDGLHQAAGSRDVLEVHGRFGVARCLSCGRRYETRAFVESLAPGEEPRCEVCPGLVKPDVVLFGEPLDPDFDAATKAAAACDLLVVVGTSLEVAPVSDLVPLALSHGAALVIVNRDATSYDDEAALVLGGDLASHMRALAEDLALPL
jgi:NAD-dependent deacetylase